MKTLIMVKIFLSRSGKMLAAAMLLENEDDSEENPSTRVSYNANNSGFFCIQMPFGTSIMFIFKHI